MLDFIERAPLLDMLKQAVKVSDALGNHGSAGIYASIASIVDEMPAADVAPVVRCKDCRFYGIVQSMLCDMHRMATNNGDYCSYGVRKEDAHAD